MLASAGLMSARDAKGATPPAAPSNVNASQSTDTAIIVDWTDNAVQEDEYVIYQSHNGGAYSQVTTVGANSESHEVTGLTTGDSYQFKVSAKNEAGESAQIESNEVTLQSDVPDAPTNFQASAASESQVDLTWTDNATNEDNYVIYRDGSLIDTIPANETSYSATGLSEGTSYNWKVGAKNTGGTAFSTTISQATKLAAPSGVTKTDIGGGRIRIEWTDNSSENQQYEIFKNSSSITTVSDSIDRYDAGGDIGDTFEVQAIHSSLPNSDKVTAT